MKIAILADIHGNREALDACLAHAKAHDAHKFVFLGDLVGYGADPCYVVDLVASYRQNGAVVIKGNHDDAVGQVDDDMNVHARESLTWTRAQLSQAQKDFLATLLLTADAGDVLFVHADAANPAGWAYITHPIDAERSMRATAKNVTICGHVHRPQLYRKSDGKLPQKHIPVTGSVYQLGRDQKWLAVLGSVGQPRDENPAAAYALFDDIRGELCFQRAAYDIARAAQKIRAANLPAILSARLFVGR